MLSPESSTHAAANRRHSDRLWAKWGRNGEHHYPLAAHLLDTAAVARVLVKSWVPPRLRDHCSDLVGADLEPLVVAAAGLHDIGKASPVFQTQQMSSRSSQFDGHKRALADQGFWIPDLGRIQDDAEVLIRRHETTSATIVAGSLADFADNDLALTIAGHHGRWQLPDEHVLYDAPIVCQFYDQLQDPSGAWALSHDELTTMLRNVGVDQPDTAVAHPAIIPLLTSLVCLADWLASDELFLRGGHQIVNTLEMDPQAFFDQRLFDAVGAVEDLLGPAGPPAKPLRTVFGFDLDRPVQKAMVENATPGLTVAMVPMGDGKTEAALAHWILSASERQGLYFALPTMATADAMFSRVQQLFNTDTDTTFGALLHGRALLNSFYEPPRRDASVISGSSQRHGLTPGAWFNGRHRSLFAPVAVGTADQLLSGVLRHRYNFMRLLGAATKTVVFDEVHSYDPYMAELLAQFLRWAGFLNIDVVLLSATLPQQQLNKYVAAYQDGGSHPANELDHLPYPAVVRADGDGVRCLDGSTETSGRDVTVTLDYQPCQTVASGVVDAVADIQARFPTAKVGVIVNTVSAAQQIANELDPSALVLHSRMTAQRRASLTSEAIARFGKDSTTGVDLLISTQVAEQSIDLDFDVLITELCPAAGLVQRLGRVWRHDASQNGTQRVRPDGLAGPLCVIAHKDPLEFGPMSCLPYPALQMSRTWTDALAAGTRTELSLPGDIQHVVEAADVTWEELAGSWSELQASADRYAIDLAAMQNRAHDARVPSPSAVDTDKEQGLSEFCNGNIGNEETATRWVTMLNATILPTSESNPEAWTGTIPERPNRGEIRSLLGHTIPVSGSLARKLLNAAGTDPETGLAQSAGEHALLRDVVVVDLDEVPGLRLDERIGLSLETKEFS